MKKFISVVVVVALTVLGITDGHLEMNQKMEADMAACKVSENPPDSDLVLYFSHQQPTTRNGQCFVGCMLTMRGFIVNGAYSRAAADQLAQSDFANKPDILQKVLATHIQCEAEVGTSTDKCITGPKLMACMEKNKPMKTKI